MCAGPERARAIEYSRGSDNKRRLDGELIAAARASRAELQALAAELAKMAGTAAERWRAQVAELHNRMPVVLGRETWPAWLGEKPADARQLKAMLASYPSEAMACWPVTTRVGNVKNNEPSLIEPVSAE